MKSVFCRFLSDLEKIIHRTLKKRAYDCFLGQVVAKEEEKIITTQYFQSYYCTSYTF